MAKAINFPFSLGIPVATGLLIGMLILADPYLSVYVSLRTKGVDIPYGFSLLIFILIILVFALIVFVNKITKLNEAKTFVALYIIGLQTIALSPISKVHGDDIILLVYLTTFVISRMVEQKRLTITFLDILNLCLLFTLFLSIGNGKIGSFPGLITAFISLIVSFLIVNFCSDANVLRFLIKWLIIITVISAIVGILQETIFHFTGKLLVGFIEHKNLRHMFEPTSIGTLLRIPAFTDTYVLLAYFLITSIVMSLNILLYAPLNRRRKILLSIASVIMFIALILTFSRYSLLVLFIIIPFIFLARWPSYSIHLIAVGMLLVIGIYLTAYYKDIYDAISKEVTWGEFRMRLQLDRDGIYGFVYRHPCIGVGLVKSGEYGSHFYGWGAHNAFIRVAGDAGVLGLFSYCFILAYSLVKAFVINLNVRGPTDKGIARGLLFCFCTFLMLLQFDSTYLVIYLWFLMGVIKAADLIYTKQERNGVLCF